MASSDIETPSIWLKSMDFECNIHPGHCKYDMDIIHPLQGLTVQPLKFENGRVINPPLYGVYGYLSMAGFKVIHGFIYTPSITVNWAIVWLSLVSDTWEIWIFDRECSNNV